MQPLPLVCAVAGALVAATLMVAVFRRAIASEVFIVQCTKLAVAGNLERLQKLCGAAPFSPLACATRAAAAAAMRVAGENPVTRQRAIDEAFTHEHETRTAAVRRLVPLAALAALLLVGAGIAPLVTEGRAPGPPVLVAGGVGLLLLAKYAQLAHRLVVKDRGYGRQMVQVLGSLTK